MANKLSEQFAHEMSELLEVLRSTYTYVGPYASSSDIIQGALERGGADYASQVIGRINALRVKYGLPQEVYPGSIAHYGKL